MSGTLQASVIKDEASATNNLTLNTSGGVTVGQNLAVTGTSTFTGSLGNVTTGTISSGNITSSGTVTAATGTLYPIVSGTAQASTSGTSITFSSIPSWVKRITVMFNAVSTNGTANFQVQIGTGGSPTISGYSSGSSYTGGTNAITFVSGTTGMVIANGSGAVVSLIGQMVFTLQTGNAWVQTHTYYNSDGRVGMGGGNITLSGILDNIRVIASTTGNPADTFDAGSINILYE